MGMATAKVWNSSDYGLAPNTGIDITAQLRAFVQDGLAQGATHFRFAPGTYACQDSKAITDLEAYMRGEGSWDLGERTAEKNILLQLQGVPAITLDFQGATLLFHGLIQPFSFDQCGEVHISNVIIDWDRPLFSQGKIVSAAADYLDIQMQSEFPVHAGVPMAAMIDYMPGSAYPLKGSIDWFHFAEETIELSPQLLRLKLKPPYQRANRPHSAAFPAVGMHVALRHIMNYKAALLFHQCRRVQLDAVTIHSVPGMGVIGHGCGEVAMRQLRVVRRPGSGFALSANTDATHFIGCTGPIFFDQCLFEGMGDDAANVHGFYISAAGRPGDREVVGYIGADIQSEYPEMPAAGDLLELTRCATLRPYRTLEVERATPLPGGRFAIRFTEGLPADYREDDLFANASRVAPLDFCNCTVRNNRARALLVQTRVVRIANNLFDHCTGTAIHVNCAVGWKESICTSDVHVSHNIFVACGLGAGTYQGASALALMTESEHTVAGTHHCFSFEHNAITGNGGIALLIGGLSGGRIIGNQLQAVAHGGIRLAASCEDVVVEGNTII